MARLSVLIGGRCSDVERLRHGQFPFFRRARANATTAAIADDGDDCMEVHHFTSDPSLQRRSSRRLRSHALALRLGQAIRHSWWEAYPLSRSLENPPVGEPRAIDVDAVLADSVEWMSATRMVLTDIVHDFGLLEVLQINEDGSLNTRWWQPQMLDGWKAVAAVPKTDREILLSP